MADTKISALTLTTLFEGDDDVAVSDVTNTSNKRWPIKRIGGITRRAISGADTLVAGDRAQVVDVTGGTFTLGTTAAATLKDGWWCVVKNSGTGILTIDPNGAETIDGATTLVLGNGALRIVYTDGANFFTLTLREPNPQTKRVGTNVNSTSTTLAKVTDLDQPLAPGSYHFVYAITYRSSNAGAGVAFNVNFSGTQTSIPYQWRWIDISSVAATGAATQSDNTTGQVVGAYASRIARTTAAFGVTISVDTIDVDLLMIVEGNLEVTVAGNLELYFGSEVAATGTQTVRAGSGLIVTKLG